jgi:hypothetical protein
MASTINGTSTGSGGLISTGDDSGILNIQTNETTAIAIDDSQRVSFVAGTAALPAITTTGDTNTGIFFPAADTIAFAEGGSEAMRLDASGNLGLGATPSAWSVLVPTMQFGATGFVAGRTTNPEIYLGTNAYYNGSAWIYKNTNVATLYAQDTGNHKWYSAASGTAGNNVTFTQAMTLDSSGNLLVGTTSVVGGDGAKVNISSAAAIATSSPSTATSAAIGFHNPNGRIGYIGVSGSATSYNTSSDYRLKNTIAPITGALAKVVQLKPVTYKWNADGSDGQGFIAHELAEVCPDAVTGEKDAVDADGNPQYQGIDTSFLVATLTAAIQEQQAIIESLTQRITALEGAE